MVVRPSRPRYYKLETALQYKSRNKPWPFVIAHECADQYTDVDGVKKQREREYFAFDDLESFMQLRGGYPHSHEVIFARNGFTQEGRLVFDFDIDQQYYKIGGRPAMYVSPSFEKDVEYCVKLTFRTYYKDVNVDKLRFVWLATNHPDKFSEHLIVKNAVFSTDWTLQLYTFYVLYALIAHRSGLFTYIPLEKRVDLQVAKTNSTMRMAYSSKLKNGRVMLPKSKEFEDGTPITFRDTLVQLYTKDDAKTEQRIVETQLAIDKVLALTKEELTTEEKIILRKIPQLQRCLEEIERENTYASFEMTKECEELLQIVGDCFEIRSVEPGRILLNRVASGPCPISGHIHDSEGACILVYRTGASYFHCFRPMCLMPDGSNKLKLKDAEGEQLPTPEEALAYFESIGEIEKKDKERGIIPDLVPLDNEENDDSEDEEEQQEEDEEDDDEEDQQEHTNNTQEQQKKAEEKEKETDVPKEVIICVDPEQVKGIRKQNWDKRKLEPKKVITPSKKTVKMRERLVQETKANYAGVHMRMPPNLHL